MKLSTLKLMTIAATLALVSTAHAGKEDLRVFNVLNEIGVEGEQFMSQYHMSVTGIECAYAVQAKTYDCNMSDGAANEGQGGDLEPLAGRVGRT